MVISILLSIKSYPITDLFYIYKIYSMLRSTDFLVDRTLYFSFGNPESLPPINWEGLSVSHYVFNKLNITSCTN